MGRLIEQQAVIDCLTNTAKYFDNPQADEWTKGIHYGLLHGLDNILDNVPAVETIPIADYEARLKADMVAMLTEIQLEFEENTVRWYVGRVDGKSDDVVLMETINDIIQQKINSLKAKIELQESEDKE